MCIRDRYTFNGVDKRVEQLLSPNKRGAFRVCSIKGNGYHVNVARQARKHFIATARAIGQNGDAFHALLARVPHNIGQIATQERFAARDNQARDAQLRQDGDCVA